METRVTLWDGSRPPDERALRARFAAQNLEPYAWGNPPGDVYAPHSHPYHKVLMVLRGSITFGLPDEGRYLTLHAGDRLDLPPGVVHDAQVGEQGVTCLEAVRQ